MSKLFLLTLVLSVATINAEFERIGQGFCTDANNRFYDYGMSTLIENPKACSKFCENTISPNKGVVGFHYTSDLERCYCLYDNSLGKKEPLYPCDLQFDYCGTGGLAQGIPTATRGSSYTCNRFDGGTSFTTMGDSFCMDVDGYFYDFGETRMGSDTKCRNTCLNDYDSTHLVGYEYSTNGGTCFCLYKDGRLPADCPSAFDNCNTEGDDVSGSGAVETTFLNGLYCFSLIVDTDTNPPTSKPTNAPTMGPTFSPTAPTSSPTSAPTPKPWVRVFKEDFEDESLDLFRPRGKNSFFTTQQARNGNQSMKLRGQKKAYGITPTPIDITGSNKFEIKFFYKMENLEAGDIFLIEYKEDGGSWQILKEQKARSKDIRKGDIWIRHTLTKSTNASELIVRIRSRFDTTSKAIYIENLTVRVK